MSRARWMAEGAVIVLIWVVSCLGATLAVLEFTNGAWELIGLVAVALIAAPLFDARVLFTERGYEEYREHWTRTWVRLG